MIKREFFRHFRFYLIISLINFGLFAYFRLYSEQLDVNDVVNLQAVIEFGKYKIAFILNIFISFLLAIITSLFDIFVLKRLSRNQNLIVLMFVGLLIDILIITTLLQGTRGFLNGFMRHLTGVHQNFITKMEILPLTIQFLFTLFLGRLMIEIDKKLGPGNLWKMMTGKFMKPREEERIFMFVDMKNSTSIAEKLGHLKFSSLIQDCFYDFSVVDNYRAEIYQYVGDEVVVSWSVNSGMEGNNCLEAFYAFNRQIHKKSDYYQKKYGIIPYFKAGMHVGVSVVTEVGEIKKEISYHGDTINTASRIQEMCNIFESQFLISEEVYLHVRYSKGYTFEKVGTSKLKGKTKEVKLYRVKKD